MGVPAVQLQNPTECLPSWHKNAVTKSFLISTVTSMKNAASTSQVARFGRSLFLESAESDEPEDDSVAQEMTADDHNYEVVAPPIGATVPYLPDEAKEKTVGGTTYMVHEDTYYRPFVSEGDTIYQVVEDPS